MKKSICILMTVVLLFGLCACGAKPAEEKTEKWTRAGYFSDENEDMLSITWMDDVDEPGWYVGVMLDELWGGCTLPQVGATLHGDLNAADESAEPFVVTISEEGEDGLLLEVEGGQTYHFVPKEMQEATIITTVNTEGFGNIATGEGEAAPEIDPERPFQSAQINLADPAVYTFVAWPKTGNLFVKWMKNGEDYSTDAQITVQLDESAEYVAVFEEDPDWQNPVMNFVGEYQCERAIATVECFDVEEALITIKWGGSAWEKACWTIIGRLDTETKTIAYEGANKANLVYGEDGEITSQEDVYTDGTGTIVFHDDGTFTWHEDQSETGTDLVFAPAWVD